jgi:aquaporin Z
MKYAAELFGTFALVFAGLGTAIIHGDQVGHMGIAFAFGLTLLAMVYTVGPISGCHINPAVTFGMLLSRRIGGGQAVGYWIAQIIGGILGAALVLAIANGAPGGFSASGTGFAATGFGEHSPGHYNLLAGFLAETFLTMLLVITVLGATDVKAPAGFAGLPIGLVLTVIILVGIPVTNGSFNPARSIGPAVFVGGWALSQLWLFIVAPLVGGAIAAGIYSTIRESVVLISAKKAEQALPSEQRERHEP